MIAEPTTATRTPIAFITVFVESFLTETVIISPNVLARSDVPSVRSSDGIIQPNTAATRVTDNVVIVGHISGIHILPNCFSTIIVQATLCTGYALLDISAMSFLGLGVQEPQADWGKMLADGKDIIMTNPTLVISSGIIIMITIICINLVGEALDSYFDPRRRKV